MKRKNYLQQIVKRVLTLIMCACVFCSTVTLPVRADAIWEPSDDFYWNHASECEYVGTDYLTNGKEGYVNLYREPNSDEVVATIKNGKRFYVGFSWTDKNDKVWAVLSLWNFEPEEGEMIAEENMDAWLPMEDLARLYNEADFRADYEETFAEYTGEMKGYEIKNAIYLWEYPGSQVNKGWITSYMEEGDEPVYQYLYTDPDGRRWTYIGYYYSHRGWVCIDEPESEAIVTGYEPQSVKDELYQAALPGENDLQADEPAMSDIQTKQEAMGIAGGAVAGLVVITAALIAILFGKKNKDKGDR